MASEKALVLAENIAEVVSPAYLGRAYITRWAEAVDAHAEQLVREQAKADLATVLSLRDDNARLREINRGLMDAVSERRNDIATLLRYWTGPDEYVELASVDEAVERRKEAALEIVRLREERARLRALVAQMREAMRDTTRLERWFAAKEAADKELA